MSRHASCKKDGFAIVFYCSQCGEMKDAQQIIDALEVLLEAIEGNRLTVGDCNQARAAIAKARG